VHDPRETLRAAAAALDAFDLPLAQSLLAAARAARPDHPELHAAWVSLCVEHLGDDAGALDAPSPRTVSPTTRAHLLLAAARSRRLDDGRAWQRGLSPHEHTDAWAAWIDALRFAGALDEADAVATGVRRPPVHPALRPALAALDDALRPARQRAAEEARVAREAAHGRRVDALRELLHEGRWEAVEAAMLEDPPREGALAVAWQALREEVMRRRDEASRAASRRRVDEVTRALAEGVTRRALRAFAALIDVERAGVDPALLPPGLLALLADPRVREVEAIDAALALREAAPHPDPLPLLRPHEAALRRVPEGRAALEAAERRAVRAPVTEVLAGASPALRVVESLAAQGHWLAAWRLAAREGHDDRAAALRARAVSAHALRWEAGTDGPPEEAHAELLRDDALVAHPIDEDHALTLSFEGATATTRRVDLRGGRVIARAHAGLAAPFVPRAFRWDGALLGAASRGAVLSVDVDDGGLRALWPAPPTELLAPSPRPCGDADFAWVHGRGEQGEGVVEVWDLARVERVRRFECDDLVDVQGAAECLTRDARGLQLRDAHGVVLAGRPFAPAGTLLDAVPLPGEHGVLATFRERIAPSNDDRRYARPPTFRLLLVRLAVAAREVTALPLRSCARDDTAALALHPLTRLVWVRLGPRDLPGELLSVRSENLRFISRRPIAAGVALRATARGPLLSLVSIARVGWQTDLRFDPPGAGDAVPGAVHQAVFARALPCAPTADEDAWRAHGPAVASLRRGGRDALVIPRAPSAALALHLVLLAAGFGADADAVLDDARRRSPTHAALRLAAADRAWREGDPGAVRALLEGAELVGLGDTSAHARHLLGLARLEEGDEAGADAAWAEGEAAAMPREVCALRGARDVLRASRGALFGETASVLAAALRGDDPAASRAAQASSAGPSAPGISRDG
jgi:hypothetical protein